MNFQNIQNNFQNNTEIDTMMKDYDELMTKKTMYNEVMKNGKKENCISDRGENVNFNNNDVKMFNNVLDGNNGEKKKHSNLADIEIFDEKSNLNLKDMCFPLIFLAIGKPASGKSVFIKNLIYNYSKLSYLKWCLAIVPSKFNSGYDYLPEKYVMENYSEEYLKKFFEKIKDFKKKNGYSPPGALILDDILGNCNLYSPWWSHFFSCYRHYNVSVVFGSQTISGRGAISTLLRQVCNVTLMYRNVYNDHMEAIYRAFGALFEDFDEFKKVYLEITAQKYHSLMFVNDKDDKSSSYYDYISEVSPNFKLNY